MRNTETDQQSRSLYHDVVDGIQVMIQSGELQPGDALMSERELSDHFGVGRPSVRQALFVLDRMKLIETRNGGRAQVREPTAEGLFEELANPIRYMMNQPEWVAQFEGVRFFMEIGLVRHAALIANAEQIDLLSETLNANGAAIGHPKEFQDSDLAFHICIAEMADNPVLLNMYTASRDWMTKEGLYLNVDEVHDRKAHIAHTKIFAAIAENDPDRTEAAMRLHLKEARDPWVIGPKENASH
jgi:GntR family transcriptional regulator, sialic acid-inducible nan operon repressor